MAQGVDERTGSSLPDAVAVPEEVGEERANRHGGPPSATLGGLAAALDVLCNDQLGLLTGPEQLGVLKDSLRLGARLQAWQAQLAARIDRAEIAWQEHGTSTSTWLADAVNLTRREAARLIAAGHGLARFPLVAEAAAAGEVLPAQAEAITAVLDDLPEDFSPDVVTEAQELLVGFAGSHNSVELRRLTSHLVEILDPDTAEAREAARLEREHRLAQRHRHLTFSYDHHGSVLFNGSLPVVEAEPFIKIIDSYGAQAKRGIDRLDPNAEYMTPAMRRADALLAMVNRHAQDALAPSHGGDRPRIVLTLSHDRLVRGCLDAHLIDRGEPISASEARLLLCDADLMPVVLGGPSEVLDVGRTQRLVTPAIRAALEVRDGGCVFPGCATPPRDCHAHHLQPWWAGGATALCNLVLMCAHHHGIVEPGHDPAADRWKVDLQPDGTAHILPPLRVDPHQRPRLHARFLTRRRP